MKSSIIKTGTMLAGFSACLPVNTRRSKATGYFF